ncbi:TIGR03862 family flavoprotein [Halobacteriovorax sp. RT-2-4]|uniref:TIGR03862 family flavoprotein n=1 Tax=unclassified Halobacteriovorax TaxID=2639665 RepID=UPI00399AF20E
MSNQVVVAIVGGGPAGLFCAYELLNSKIEGIEVHLYEQTGGVGKKFLVAGNSGLNLTHSEKQEEFAKKYFKDEARFRSLLKDFNANDLIEWANTLGTETFIGTSGRVFPKKMKAADILHQWMNSLKSHENFHLHLKHSLTNITADGDLIFKHDHSNKTQKADYYILAMGGGSWSKTGSDGVWMEYIEALGVKTAPLKAMNCGFEINWSKHFQDKVDRGFVKNIVVSNESQNARGEIMLTPYGVEGGAVYAISNGLRDELEKSVSTKLHIDFKPDLKRQDVIEKLSRRNKDSLTNRLRKNLNFDKIATSLLYEVLDRSKAQEDVNYLAAMVKDCEIEVLRARPMDEAISTSGGVCFESLNDDLSAIKNNQYYFVGEMLDFEAPTGGYLLQGCFSSAYRVVKSIKEKEGINV